MSLTWLYFPAILIGGLWVAVLAYCYLAIRAMPLLRDSQPRLPDERMQWPLVSIIIPARDEADHIQAALTSILALNYPRLEIALIDDRSTDDTGRIIDLIAQSDPRVTPVHVESLPAGWLGKVHALHEGVQRALGDWYLFTDADVHFEPDALSRAVAYAKRHELDHIACLPEVIADSSFWLDVAVRATFVLLCTATRWAEVNRESGKRSFGVGAFNLVERKAFERTAGFAWLRMEPGDDVGLGLMLNEAGARMRLINGDGVIRVRWYDSLWALTRGLEKNSFGPAANYSYVRQLLGSALLWSLVSLPPLSLSAGVFLGDIVLGAAGALAFLASLVWAFVMPRKSVRDLFAYLFVPFGIVLVSLISLRSAWKCFRSGGIDWRGTHYSLEALRAGQRVRF